MTYQPKSPPTVIGGLLVWACRNICKSETGGGAYYVLNGRNEVPDQTTEGRVRLVVYYLLICRSLTYAQRTAKALEHTGITAIVTKTPLSISSDGCGYCVKVSAKHISNALVTLKDADFYPIKIFVLYADGNYGEVKI